MEGTPEGLVDTPMLQILKNTLIVTPNLYNLHAVNGAHRKGLQGFIQISYLWGNCRHWGI